MNKPHLQTLIFETTSICNHACLHCYNVWQPNGSNGYPRGQLDTDKTLALLNKALDETHCRHITLTGGEPLMRQDLPQILDQLHQRNVMTTIISNGRLLNEESVLDCIQRGIALFELPLLSHKREVHDQLSGSAGAFDTVLRAMANIRYQSGRFVAVFVVTQLNYQDVSETIKLAYAFGASGFMLNRFNSGGRGRIHMETLQLTLEQLRHALSEANFAAEKYNFTISSSIPLQPCLVDMDAYPNLRYGFCAAGSDHAYYTIDPMGNLRPCNHSTTILGNLFEESFGDLITGDSMKSFIDAVPAVCAPCVIREDCQGGCKAAAQVCYGSLSAEEPFLHAHRDIAQQFLEG